MIPSHVLHLTSVKDEKTIRYLYKWETKWRLRNIEKSWGQINKRWDFYKTSSKGHTLEWKTTSSKTFSSVFTKSKVTRDFLRCLKEMVTSHVRKLASSEYGGQETLHAYYFENVMMRCLRKHFPRKTEKVKALVYRELQVATNTRPETYNIYVWKA